MPKLWNETIDMHRQAVRDASLDAAGALVEELGLASVTMSKIAERTGIGRATLYKYFPDLDAVLVAWHQRHIQGHLEHLQRIRDLAGAPGTRLRAVLEAYALISHERHGSELAALLHRGEHVSYAHRQLNDLVRDLIVEGAEAGTLRSDVAADELATYCLHALTAASGLSSKNAVSRLVEVALSALRPQL